MSEQPKAAPDEQKAQAIKSIMIGFIEFCADHYADAFWDYAGEWHDWEQWEQEDPRLDDVAHKLLSKVGDVITTDFIRQNTNDK